MCLLGLPGYECFTCVLLDVGCSVATSSPVGERRRWGQQRQGGWTTVRGMLPGVDLRAPGRAGCPCVSSLFGAGAWFEKGRDKGAALGRRRWRVVGV